MIKALVVNSPVLIWFFTMVVSPVVYSNIYFELSRELILFSFLSWLTMSVSYVTFVSGKMNDALSLGTDEYFLDFITTLFFMLIPFAIFSGILGAREMDPTLVNQSFSLKIILILEQFYIVLLSWLICKFLNGQLTYFRFVKLILIFLVAISISGRLGLVIGVLLGFLMAYNSGFKPKLKKIMLITLVFLSGLVGIQLVRFEGLILSTLLLGILDRFGEFATLSYVDYFYINKSYALFENVSNLMYMYTPAYFYPAKPVINDGALIMRESFGLGEGAEIFTRFPILLHNDLFRRFGYYGLFFYPIIFCLTGKLIDLVSKVKLPSLKFIMSSVVFVNLVYIYPKSMLGSIELMMYTVPRNFVFLLFFFFCFSFLMSVAAKVRSH